MKRNRVLGTYHLCVAMLIFLSIGLHSCSSKKGASGLSSSADLMADQSLQKFQEAYFEAQKQKAINNSEKAYEKFLECSKLYPDEDATFYELAKLDTLLNNYPSALSNITKASGLAPNNLWYSRLMSDVQTELGELEAALKTLKRIADTDPNEVLYRDKLASLAIYLKDYNSAIEAYKGIENIVGVNSDLSKNIYDVYMQKGDEESAIKELEKLAAYYPNNVDYKLRISHYYSLKNENFKAEEILQEVITSSPENGNANLAMAELILTKEDKSTAFSYLKIGFKDIDGSLSKKLELMNAFSALKAAEEDQSVLLNVLETTHPGESAVWKVSGDVHESNGKTKEAIGAYSEALSLTPNDISLWLRTVRMADENNQNDEQIDLSEKAQTYFPLAPEFYYYKGNGLLKNKDLEEAIESYQGALDVLIDNAPLERKIALGLARAHFAQAEYDLAQNWIDESLSEGKILYAEDLELKGDILFKLGRSESAIEFWNKAKNADLGNTSDVLERKIVNEQYISE